MVSWPSGVDILTAHGLIHEIRVPNFLQCRIPLEIQLKPQALGYKVLRTSKLISSFDNYISAMDHDQHISQ